MIDAARMIAGLPAELRRSCLDAASVPHACAITQTETAPRLTDAGIAFAGEADTLYVAKPFIVPQGDRLTIISADGKRATRRVETITDNIDFLTIVLGEVT